MIRQRWRWLLFGLITYGVFLLASLPAAYVVPQLPGLQLTGVHGSPWSGKANQLLVQGVPLGSLRWRFDWQAPFTATLGYRLTLRAEGLEVRGRAAQGIAGKVFLRDITGYMPVSALDSWLPLPPHSLTGRLGLQLSRVVLVRNRPRVAEGSLTLTNAQLSWPANALLGNYRLTLHSNTAQGIQGTLADTGGPLRLQGKLSVTIDGRYEVSGTLASRNPGDSTTGGLLQYLGAPDASGNRHFQLSGQF
ncbi:MAG: type II secretion system protein N [Gammaproteobacteria bacterium]|nr:type II secretion system protein N [Gammaproteobacteria bacterium]